MKEIILKGTDIMKQFDDATSPLLQHMDISIYDGDFTVIMGASGSGKSTLLYALSGMDNINKGNIVFQNQDITNLHEKEMATLRCTTFGFIFQQIHLIGNLTLFENIAVAGYRNVKRSGKKTQERVHELLHRLHIEHVLNHLPNKVSGGEAQRAAIARAIINEPQLLFADEPTGALSRKHSDDVLTILCELNAMGQSILMVTHDIHAASFGNRILYLEDGAILDELDLSNMKKCELNEKEVKVNEWLTSRKW